MRFRCMFQQDTSDCGAASLAMICRHYGFHIGITKVRELIGTDKNGTSGYGLLNGSRKLGLECKVVRVNDMVIDKTVPLPCIAQVKIGVRDHYVVVYALKKKKLCIADPDEGLVKKTHTEFAKIWSGILFFLEPSDSFKKNKMEKPIKAVTQFFSSQMKSSEGSNSSVSSRIDWLSMTSAKKMMIRLMVLSIIGVALGIFSSFYYKILIDDVLPKGRFKELKLVSLIFLLIGVFETVFISLQSYLFSIFGGKVSARLVANFYDHMLKLPMRIFGARDTGELISRIDDAYEVKDTFVRVLIDGCLNLIMVLGCSITLCVINSKLFLVVLVILISYSIVLFIFKNRISRRLKERIECGSRLDSLLIESIGGIETIKSLGTEKEFSRNFNKNLLECMDKENEHHKVAVQENILIGLISATGGIAVLWLGVYGVMAGTLSFGAFLTFNALLVFFLSPAQELINFQSTIQLTWINFCRLREMMELETETKLVGNKEIENLQVSIEFKNVNFRYGSRKLTLSNLNAKILPREKVAIVGPSGAGKSTISKLLMGFYYPEDGEVLWGKNNIKELNIASIRDKIAYMPQSVVLFRGTIEDNLKQRDVNLPDLEFKRICDLCGVTQFVQELPGGYKFKITEQGANFSSGQRQRLALARVMMKKPDVVILDEATSNIDSITENQIIKLLFKECEESTIIMIAHRLTTALHCDRIFVVSNGQVVAEGTDQQLKEHCELYRMLWDNY